MTQPLIKHRIEMQYHRLTGNTRGGLTWFAMSCGANAAHLSHSIASGRAPPIVEVALEFLEASAPQHWPERWRTTPADRTAAAMKAKLTKARGHT